MDLQLNAYAVEINVSSGDVAGQHDLGLTNPLYAYVDRQNNLLVLGYDYVARSSWISLYDGSFGLQRSVKVNVLEDLENQVQKHQNKSGTQFPFFVGEWTEGGQSGYFVNCFYNYTLRTVYFESAGLTMMGNIYSFQTQAAVSSLIQRTDKRYALTRFYSNNNYLLGDVEVDIATSQNFNDLTGEVLHELVHDAKVLSEKITIGANSYILFASQTNSNSMVTYQHAAEADSLIATQYHQFNERVEVSDIIQTKEEGVALLGRIYILGKYQRPVLVKLPCGPFLHKKYRQRDLIPLPVPFIFTLSASLLPHLDEPAAGFQVALDNPQVIQSPPVFVIGTPWPVFHRILSGILSGILSASSYSSVRCIFRSKLTNTILSNKGLKSY